MIRQTLRGLRSIGRAVLPICVLATPPIAGALLIEYGVVRLGVTILSLSIVGFILVIAHTIGQYEGQQ